MATVGNKIPEGFDVKLLNKYNFLLRNNNMVFTTIDHDGKLSKMTREEIIQLLVELDILKSVTEFHVLDNPFFYFISFRNAEVCTKFKEAISQLKDKQFIICGSNLKSNGIRINVLWTPLIVVLKSLKDLIAKFGNIKKITPTYTHYGGSIKIISSPIAIDLELRSGISIKDIPRIFVNQHGFKSYLSIEDSPRLCFKCLETNHIFKNCPNKHCHVCGLGQPNNHVCMVSSKIEKYFFPLETSQVKPNLVLPKCEESSPLVHKIPKKSARIDLSRCHSEEAASSLDSFDEELIAYPMSLEDQEGMTYDDLDEIRKLIEMEYNIHSKEDNSNQQSGILTRQRKRKGKLK